MRSIIFLCLLCSFVDSQAQFKVYGIVKDSMDKTHHGEVIKYEPHQYVDLSIHGIEKRFDLDNVNSFKFTSRTPGKKYIFPLDVGYHNFSLGLISNYKNSGTGKYITYGYTHQKFLRLGYGGGISLIDYNANKGYTFLNIFGQFKSYLFEKNASPFILGKIGYGIALLDPSKFMTEAEGGLYSSVDIGLRTSTNRMMIEIYIGGTFQKAYHEFEYLDYSETIDSKFKRIHLGFGITW